MGRVTWRGVVVDDRTAEMLEELAANTGSIYINPTQGSYSGSVSASAGTHDGCGAVDLMHYSWSVADYDTVVREARKVGFAAWHRTPQQANWPRHCHLIAVQKGGKNDRGCLSSGAHNQVVSYFNGRNGLASNAPDDGPRTHVGVTWESYQKENNPMGLKRVDYKPYSKASGKNNRKFQRGKWQRIATGVKAGSKGTQTLMLGQFRIKPVSAHGVYCRFVRVRPDGKRDGTGDAYFALPPGGGLPMSHQHVVAGGNFTWDLEVKVPGSGDFVVAYTYAKSFV